MATSHENRQYQVTLHQSPYAKSGNTGPRDIDYTGVTSEEKETPAGLHEARTRN